MGFRKTKVDYSVFIQIEIIIAFHVYDLQLNGKSIDKINRIKRALKEEFKMIDLE